MLRRVLNALNGTQLGRIEVFPTSSLELTLKSQLLSNELNFMFFESIYGCFLQLGYLNRDL